jgi:4-hydroxybenzoate polyprenyltransferase
MGVEEDIKSKPWRPIPSGQMSLEHAITYRWFNIILCLIFSLPFGRQVFGVSCILSLCNLLYNLTDAHGHWILKNILNSAGYACFLWGGTLLSGANFGINIKYV